VADVDTTGFPASNAKEWDVAALVWLAAMARRGLPMELVDPKKKKKQNAKPDR